MTKLFVHFKKFWINFKFFFVSNVSENSTLEILFKISTDSTSSDNSLEIFLISSELGVSKNCLTESWKDKQSLKFI